MFLVFFVVFVINVDFIDSVFVFSNAFRVLTVIVVVFNFVVVYDVVAFSDSASCPWNVLVSSVL